MLDGLPRNLEEEAMLRVHDGRLVWRERPKRRVEPLRAVHQIRGGHEPLVGKHVRAHSLGEELRAAPHR